MQMCANLNYKLNEWMNVYKVDTAKAIINDENERKSKETNIEWWANRSIEDGGIAIVSSRLALCWRIMFKIKAVNGDKGQTRR